GAVSRVASAAPGSLSAGTSGRSPRPVAISSGPDSKQAPAAVATSARTALAARPARLSAADQVYIARKLPIPDAEVTVDLVTLLAQDARMARDPRRKTGIYRGGLDDAPISTRAKVVVVHDASRPIARAVALALADRGQCVL